MGQLIYSAIASLDGYIEDHTGNFDWAAPDEEVHAFVNDLLRPVGTYLYGRRMYEMMTVWETDPALAADSPITADFAALWKAAEKIVYSTTLASPATARTRLERRFEPQAVRDLLAVSPCDFAIGGAGLAAQALEAGLVTEFQFFIVPFVVGGGKRLLPYGVFLPMELLDQRRFHNGTVYLRYRLK